MFGKWWYKSKGGDSLTYQKAKMYLYVFAFAALLSGEMRLQFRDVMSDLQVLSGTVSRETSISCAWVGNQCMVRGKVSK